MFSLEERLRISIARILNRFFVDNSKRFFHLKRASDIVMISDDAVSPTAELRLVRTSTRPQEYNVSVEPSR